MELKALSTSLPAAWRMHIAPPAASCWPDVAYLWKRWRAVNMASTARSVLRGTAPCKHGCLSGNRRGTLWFLVLGVSESQRGPVDRVIILVFWTALCNGTGIDLLYSPMLEKRGGKKTTLRGKKQQASSVFVCFRENLWVCMQREIKGFNTGGERKLPEPYFDTGDGRRQVVLMSVTSHTPLCALACASVCVGRFRWQRWHWAMCTVIHSTSAFQEQQRSTQGRPKQPHPQLCGAAVNKRSHLSRKAVMVCSIPGLS